MTAAAGTRPCPECGTETARPYCATCGLILPGAGGVARAVRDRAPKEWRFVSRADWQKWRRLLIVLVVVGLVAGAVGVAWRLVPFGTPAGDPATDEQYYLLVKREDEHNYQGLKNPQVVLDINTATYAQLVTVPAISYRNAMYVLAYRHNHGAFKSAGELRTILNLALTQHNLQTVMRQLKVESPTAAPADAQFLALYRRVNLNTATPELIELLPGIGVQVRMKITTRRVQRGGFCTFDDVARVFGEGTRYYRPLIPFDFFTLGDEELDRKYREEVARFYRDQTAGTGDR